MHVDWKAWYTRGRVYDSDDTDWKDLPRTGVLGVVVYLEPPYRRLESGGDWYYIEDGEPVSTNTHPQWGSWIDPPDAPIDELKRGEGTSDEKWDKVHTEMMEAK